MSTNNQSVPLVVAFTPNYFIPAAACLSSVIHSSEKEDRYHVICLLSEELPEQMKRKLQLIGGKQIEYSFINLQGKLSDIQVDERFTTATLYRLLIPNLLLEYDKVLYIDCDVIVRNNLAHLYRTVDLKDNYLAGVFETPMDFQIAHIKEIGCTPSTYINAGFLIMNLNLLRKDNMVQKLIETVKTNLSFFDQDALNICCNGHILGLPPHYNSIRTFYLPQYKPFFLQRYTEKDWEKIHQCGTVHYTGSKPWNSFTVEFLIWWHYYEQLPQEVKAEWKVNKNIYFLYKLYKSSIGNTVINTIQKLYRKCQYKHA